MGGIETQSTVRQRKILSASSWCVWRRVLPLLSLLSLSHQAGGQDGPDRRRLVDRALQDVVQRLRGRRRPGRPTPPAGYDEEEGLL